MVFTATCPSHLILWFPPIQFTIDSESTMDPFCLKLQVERGSYIRAYYGGFRSSIGIQIEQSTNQPKLFTNPEIQPEACIVTERSKNCLPACLPLNTQRHHNQALQQLCSIAMATLHLIPPSLC
jgi:anaerobic glycerol-3-phosphate dehydrogenase